MSPLPGSSQPLGAAADVALLDLDGVVYVGDRPVDHAAAALAEARGLGLRLVATTNNALRPAAAVAALLTQLGVPATAADVVTSAQAAAGLVAGLVDPGALVLACGGAGLVDALRERGLRATASDQADVRAVVTGYDPTLTWERMAAAVTAVRRGVPWIASNTDTTVPGHGGVGPGAGALVAFVRTGAGSPPRAVAGKPGRALIDEAVRRTGAQAPLVVGDRLDTDIAGAVAARLPSLLVLTGVCRPVDVLGAGPAERPTHLAADLRGLLHGHPTARAVDGGWEVGAARAAAVDGRLTLSGLRRDTHGSARAGDGWADGLDALRASCVCAWAAADAGAPLRGLTWPVVGG